MNGILNVYKERGFTSHDVVAKLRGILKQKKIGHTGTLDPEAEGVLPVCLGNATKLCDLLTDKTKEYEAVLQLGVTTDTQDMTGQVLTRREVCVSEEEIQKIMLSYIGKSEQIPPMYSALKVGGKKLYELAREGKEVQRTPRPIEIFTMNILKTELPYVRFCVSCSKGTYIRTLCHDIGQKAGCGGAMAQLLRTRVGNFRMEEAYTLSRIETLQREGRLAEIVCPVDAMFPDYPAACVKREYVKTIENGNSFVPSMCACVPSASETERENPLRVRVYNEDHVFYGIYEYCDAKACFQPYKMFLDRS